MNDLLNETIELLDLAARAFRSHAQGDLVTRARACIDQLAAKKNGLEVQPVDRLANVSDSFVLDWAAGIVERYIIVQRYIQSRYKAMSMTPKLAFLDDVCIGLRNLATHFRGGESAETDAIVDGLAVDLAHLSPKSGE